MRNHSATVTDDAGDSVIYSCSACDVNFDTKREISLHMLHEHNQDYTDLNECNICSIAFHTVDELATHLMDDHELFDKLCDICNEPFDSKVVYEQHMLDHDVKNIKKDLSDD